MSYVKTPLELEAPFSLQPDFIAASVNVLVQQCHGAQVKAGWWTHINNKFLKEESCLAKDLPANRSVPELLMLIVSELAEAMEGDRKNLQDDKLPQYKMIDVELADALIRICDLAGARAAPLGEILAAKMQYNAQRADHKPENRALPGGKKY